MTERSCLCRPLLVGLQYVGDCPWSRQVSGMGINWGRKDESSQTKHSGRIFTVAQFGSGNDVDPASSSFQREAERTWSLVSGPYMMDIAVPLQSCQGTRGQRCVSVGQRWEEKQSPFQHCQLWWAYWTLASLQQLGLLMALQTAGPQVQAPEWRPLAG